MPDEEDPPLSPRALSSRSRTESGFHMKGIVYQGTQLFFQQHVRGGLDALYQEIREPELLAFIQQKFLPSSWYDVLPVARLIRYEARAMRLSVAQYLNYRTRFQAEKDIGTVYKFLLKLVSLEQVGLRVPRIIGQLFDFGTTDAKVVGPGHIALDLYGWPAVLLEWCTTAFEVYVNTAMRMSGAKEASVQLTSHTAEPSANVALITLRMDIHFA